MGLQGRGRVGRGWGPAARTAGDRAQGGRPLPGGGGGGAARSQPHPESSPRRSPGAPAGRRKCSVTPRPDRAPGRRTRGAAGRCLGHYETRDGSPLEVKTPSSRASAGRSRGQPKDPPPSPPAPSTHNFPAFHLGLAERPADLDAGLRAQGGPGPGLQSGRGGRAPRPQQLSDGAAG